MCRQLMRSMRPPSSLTDIPPPPGEVALQPTAQPNYSAPVTGLVELPPPAYDQESAYPTVTDHCPPADNDAPLENKC